MVTNQSRPKAVANGKLSVWLTAVGALVVAVVVLSYYGYPAMGLSLGFIAFICTLFFGMRGHKLNRRS